LYDLLSEHPLTRIKAVVATDQGWFIFNGADGLLECRQIQPGKESRIERVRGQDETGFPWAEIDRCLL
jgi:hypothetical protein